jgi:hypothetical protein
MACQANSRGDLDMRLSEAILLGSTVVAPQAGGQYFSKSQSGCALGMATIARGYHYGPGRKRAIREQDRRTLGTEGIWGDWLVQEVVRPCDCWFLRVPRKMRIKDIVAHLFDHHVMARKNWTLERLAAWVETVEPKDVAPSAAPGEDVMLSRLRAGAFLMEARVREAEYRQGDWQIVRRAFEANQFAKRRHRPSA